MKKQYKILGRLWAKYYLYNMKEFKTIIELTRHFHNDRICVEYLEQQRWNGKPECPHCGSEFHSRVNTRLKSPDLQGYKDFRCKACDKKYSVLTGTIFESTKVSLQKWFVAMYLLMGHKKGISSVQLASDLGITQKAAWHMLHRIREMFQTEAPQMVNDIVEVDETYVGGKNKNRHHNKKKQNTQGRSIEDKTPVVGMLARNGKVSTFVVENTNSETLQPLIQKKVSQDCIIITDAYRAYSGLNKTHVHLSIKHIPNNYVTDQHFHTNNIEGFWSLLKRSIIGIYHQVSPKHLHRYCAESAYRYNERTAKDIERFKQSFINCNKTLPYRILIAK